MGILTSIVRDVCAPRAAQPEEALAGSQPLRIFIGYDPRQAVAYHGLEHSLLARSTAPITIAPLVLDTLPMERQGLTPFTFSRFLVPWLSGFGGWSLFLDLDMLVRADISELFALADPQYAVMVVKNEQTFEWPSAMLYNCAHPANAVLTPDFVDEPELCPNPHFFDWLAPELVGALPPEWNHCVGYDAPRAEAKLVHYTQGVPYHEEVAGCEYEDVWHAELKALTSSRPWTELMANSVHAQQLPDGQVVSKLHDTSNDAGGRAAPAQAGESGQRPDDRDSASSRYRNLIALYEDMHQRGDTLNNIAADQTFDGRSLVGHLQSIATVARQFDARTMLDYGCGKGLAYNNKVQLADGSVVDDAKSLWGVDEITLYDPGYAPYSTLPAGSFDGVVCTDVLEHCPEEDVHWIVGELFGFARRFVYCTISCRLAVKQLPTGENAHITVHPPQWWQSIFNEVAARHPDVRYFATCYPEDGTPVMLNG